MAANQMSGHERAQKSMTRSQAKLSAADQKECMKVLQWHGDAVRPVTDLLVSMGFIDPVTRAAKSAEDIPLQAGESSSFPSTVQQGATAEKPKQNTPLDTNRIPTGNPKKWSDLSSDDWCHIPSNAEPISCSPAFLTVLRSKGLRYISKRQLMEIGECVGDIPMDSALPVDANGNPSTLAELTELFKFQSIANCRRGRDLQLPVDWRTSGNYIAKWATGQLYIAHRFTKDVGLVWVEQMG